MIQIALIPAYMPDGRMLTTILELKKRGFEVLVVDDGSGIKFSSLFQKASTAAIVLTSEENQGKGCALKKGLSFIQQNFAPPYVVVTVDADGQHTAPDVARVCEEALKYPRSLILGSRKLGDRVPLRSKFGNTITRIVFLISTGKSVYDTQTGLRAFSDELLPELLNISGDRYEYEMNVLMQLVRNSVETIEVPIETVYIEGNESSHFDTLKDSYRIYKEILKFSASSLISFCIDYLLFCLLMRITGMLTIANVIARICSSTVNFTINRKMVFKSDAATAKSAVSYFSVAALILLCNTLLIKGFCFAGIPAYLAKVMTEALLFVLSYFVQHTFIFKRGE